MSKGWRGESKRHALSAKGIPTAGSHSKFAMSAKPKYEMCDYLDFSNAPTSILKVIVRDKTASVVAKDKARKELKRREYNERSLVVKYRDRSIRHSKKKKKEKHIRNVFQEAGAVLDKNAARGLRELTKK